MNRNDNNGRKGSHLNGRVLGNYNRERMPVSRRRICYAPFRNMYFGRGGIVVPCCFNRDHVLGNWPSMTVQQIWDGRQREMLCRLIRKNDLGSGCHLCENLIAGGNYTAVGARFYDSVIPPGKYPRSLEFELDNTCNLSCIMCSANFSSTIEREQGIDLAGKGIYNEEFVTQLLPFLKRAHETKFYGGEPFLIPLYYSIWERLIEINPSCSILIQTNASILNDRVKELIEKGNFHLGVSIDSLVKEKYEKIRRHAGFEKVLSNIEYFAGYSRRNRRPMVVSVCPMINNWEEIPALVQYCNSIGAGIFFNTVWYPPELALWPLDAETLLKIDYAWERCLLPESSHTEKNNKKAFLDLKKMVRLWYHEALNAMISKDQHGKSPDESPMGPAALMNEYNHWLKLFLEKLEEYAVQNMPETSTVNEFREKIRSDAMQVISALAHEQGIVDVLKNAVEQYSIPEIFDTLLNRSTQQITDDLKKVLAKLPKA